LPHGGTATSVADARGLLYHFSIYNLLMEVLLWQVCSGSCSLFSFNFFPRVHFVPRMREK
jgi:hypothetical protein